MLTSLNDRYKKKKNAPKDLHVFSSSRGVTPANCDSPASRRTGSANRTLRPVCELTGRGSGAEKALVKHGSSFSAFSHSDSVDRKLPTLWLRWVSSGLPVPVNNKKKTKKQLSGLTVTSMSLPAVSQRDGEDLSRFDIWILKGKKTSAPMCSESEGDVLMASALQTR